MLETATKNELAEICANGGTNLPMFESINSKNMRSKAKYKDKDPVYSTAFVSKNLKSTIITKKQGRNWRNYETRRYWTKSCWNLYRI